MIQYPGKRQEPDEKSSNQTAWNYGRREAQQAEIWGKTVIHGGGLVKAEIKLLDPVQHM